MTDAEIRLRCMELAMQQAKLEGSHSDRNAVAEIQTWFYDRIVSEPKPSETATGRKSKKDADKAPEIFG